MYYSSIIMVDKYRKGADPVISSKVLDAFTFIIGRDVEEKYSQEGSVCTIVNSPKQQTTEYNI